MSQSTASFQSILTSLLKSLPPRPIDQIKLNDLTKEALQKSSQETSLENLKGQWEFVLKNDIFLLAATEGQALKDENTTYYDQLRDKLDVVLTFAEHDACDPAFPFVVLQDLLEMQTITSCSHIFSWIETHATRLTEGLVPQKGKALVLLRTLNDLLRRLSKMGSTTIFCGRILTFLSAVFSLGERSGVNLRGEYGPTWEGLKDLDKKLGSTEEDVTGEGTKEGVQSDLMQVDEKEVKKMVGRLSEKKSEFYNTFWSLQLPFSKPSIFTTPEAFSEFKEAVNRVFPVIKEATAKDRAMMGSRGAAAGPSSLKRKREAEVEDVQITEYFFAKFLTSPDLIDLEIADTHFRRQFLFQLLILLNHLLTFTKAAKATWVTPRNRSLHMEFTLEQTDTQWVQETVNKVMEELRQTTPNGRAFADTVSTILEREKNWVKWKNELCAPFDKEPAFVDVSGQKTGMFEATREIRQKMTHPPPDWEWRLGTEPLTEIWDMGCRGLEDLQTPFQPGEVKDFVKKVKQEDARIDLRKKYLAKIAQARAKAISQAKQEQEPTKPSEPAPSVSASADTTLTVPRPVNPPSSPLHPSLPPKPVTQSSSQDVEMKDATVLAPGPPPIERVATPTPQPQKSPAPVPAPVPIEPKLPVDEQIQKLEENKQRWAWLGLRTARDQHLQHFGKIGTGDIELLQKEIEKEAQEKDKSQKGEESAVPVNGATVVEEQAVDSSKPVVDVPPRPSREGSGHEGDVKMEEG